MAFLQVQRGEHIRKEEVKVKPRSGGRDVKKITKRQADYSEDDYSDYDDSYYDEDDYYYESDSLARQVEFDESDTEGGVIALNEIESECPAGSSCIETFFCKQISGSSLRDKIVSPSVLRPKSLHMIVAALPSDERPVRRGLWCMLQGATPQGLSQSQDAARPRGRIASGDRVHRCHSCPGLRPSAAGRS